MKPSGRLHTLGPGALSGLLLALSYPPLHPLVLPFVALVPWVVALDRCDDAREAFRTGLVFAGVHFGLVAYWIPLALGDVTRLAWALFAAGLGLIALVVGYLVGKGVAWGSGRGGGIPFQLLAVALTYVSLAMANMGFEIYGSHVNQEIEPVGLNGGNVVWEWHLMDHLIQDFDNTKANFGVVADHRLALD